MIVSQKVMETLTLKEGIYRVPLLGLSRDGNGAGFFGYPPRPAPNGTRLKFNKRVFNAQVVQE